MGSTFSGLEIGKRGIQTHQQALQTTGHNISNADNKHYSRQRVVLTANDPIYDPSLTRPGVKGQIGQGVQIAQIERVRDNFLDDRIIETQTQKSYWSKKNDYFNQMEITFNEPTGSNLRTLMDGFWSSLQDLANYPEETAHRTVVQEKATGLGLRMEDIHRKLTQMRDQSNRELESQANRVNLIAENIRNLNIKISKSEAVGDNPNDLNDKRDELLQELSGIVDISISRNDEDEMMIYVGQQILVQGNKRQNIEFNYRQENEGYPDLYWSNGDKMIVRGGSLQALIEIRDQAIPERILKIDSLAINTIDVVNEIHKDGFGLNGKTNQEFFQTRNLATNANGEIDRNEDGVPDGTAIFKVAGRNQVDSKQPIGISGQIKFKNSKEEEIVVSYFAEDTVPKVLDRINKAGTGTVAYLNHDSQISLKATSGAHYKESFQLRYIEDSGEFLVGFGGLLVASGQEGSFDSKKLGEITKFQSQSQDITLTPGYHPSSFMKLTAEIQVNPLSIAAARGNDVGGTGDYNSSNGHKDGSNALLLASALRDKPVMFDESKTTDDFYNALISKLGTETRESKSESSIQSELMVELENLRQSVMGVSLDEEMANMVQFQQSYNASARLISVLNDMLDVIINRIGA
jgi:flagellar hook-associated protein 1 FlgK